MYTNCVILLYITFEWLRLVSSPSEKTLTTNTAKLTNIVNNDKMCKQSPTY